MEDLDNGKGDIWFRLDGSKRLRYNLLTVSRMRTVPVTAIALRIFREAWGQESILESQTASLASCMADDWSLLDASPAGKNTRPFHQLQHLEIEADALGQLNPSVREYHYLRGVPKAWDYAQSTQPFEHLALLPLRPLLDNARLSTLIINLPPVQVQTTRRCSQWHNYDHVTFWRYVRQLGSSCDVYEVRGLSGCCTETCDDIVPRGARNLLFEVKIYRTDTECPETMHWRAFCAVLRRLLNGVGEGHALAQSITWRTPGPKVAHEVVDLGSYTHWLPEQPGYTPRKRGLQPRTIWRCYDAVEDAVGTVYRNLAQVEITESDSDTDDSDADDTSNVVENGQVNERFQALCDQLLWPGADRDDLIKALRSRIKLDFANLTGYEML